jgi:hypothetical protein
VADLAVAIYTSLGATTDAARLKAAGPYLLTAAQFGNAHGCCWSVPPHQPGAAPGLGQGLEARTEPVSLPWVVRISQMTMCSPAAQAPWLG